MATGAYCWPNNDAANKSTVGGLYNWYAVADSRNIAPTGWHVASDAELTTLTTFLSGESVAGGNLKETGISHWNSPNTGATNSTGFAALPGGYRHYLDGTFHDVGDYGYLWTSTAYDATYAWCRLLYYNGVNITHYYNFKQLGFSVRCVKDSPVAPTLTTTDASSIASNTATSGGNITNDGGSEITVRGVCWGTAANPTTADSKTTDGTTIGTFASNLTGLTANTLYHIRAYATNSVGTSYGNDITFTTLANPSVAPTVSTTAVTAIAQTTATSGGNVTSDGGATVTARGVCWGTATNPTIANSKTSDGTGIGTFSGSLTGLIENTTYYVKAYATNSIATSYGNEITFKTQSNVSPIAFNPDLTYGTMTDNNGNVYKTITIGTQTWMAENLKTTKYRNGDPIANVTGSSWTSLVTGAYCWYNNDSTIYKSIYGALYNWYSVNDSRNIAPAGWHVATDSEWTTLTTFLGGESVAGVKLKETGISHWLTPNTGSTNNSGFTALPGGNNDKSGSFNLVSYNGYWWSSTDYSSTNARGRLMFYDNSFVVSSVYGKYHGLSVRCIKDSPVVPTITTTDASSIASTTATSGGNITSDGGSAVTTRGVCWGTATNPTAANSKTSDGTGIGTFTSNLIGLIENTTYYVRAYATNSIGTSYGSEISFKTLANSNGITFNPDLTYGTMTDNDGNVYKTITIGTQTWMAENLKTTKYRNGDPIPNVTDNAEWLALATGAYCWTNIDPANKAVYGGLYNWYAVADSRNIAPGGWHVPTDAEWTTLTTFLGGEYVAGGKLKETSLAHWLSPNTGASNSSGFTAIPGLCRDYNNPAFFRMGDSNYLWSSTANASTTAWFRELSYGDTNAGRGLYYKKGGFSVRCVRD